MQRSRSRRLVPTAALLAAVTSCAGPAPAPAPRPAATPAPAVQPVAGFERSLLRLQPDEATRRARGARDSLTVMLGEGLRLDLWAPEPMVPDPIAIHLDSLGRAFVTRTARTNRSEIDIRGHRDWMIESITFRDVEDKRRFYQRELAPERSASNPWLQDFNSDGSRDWRDLTVHRESIYRVEDTNRDGVADLSQLVFQDLNDLVSDVAHGILSLNGDLLLTASPDLWRLRDTDGDGVMDTKQSLAHGFGVHIGFGGHGLSGPIVGPDGRLYWKMGDLGFNLVTREGERVSNTHSGAIVRSEPDGTDFEVFATGLRNPQEFAFDEYGNLITADNDGDHQGETERIVYVTEGSDAGWRINWQFGKYVDPDNNAYKVWMDESLYKPRFEGQAAYITPPIAAHPAGPSGFLYNPGTALSDAWKDHFFVTIFTGSAGNARIQGFQLREQGAGFALAGEKEMVRGILSPGMEWGPDGAIYVTDWIQGWSPKERGRVWRLDVANADAARRAETARLIAEPFAALTTPQLVQLLRHEDMRVRQKGQFGLVDRNAERELIASARQREHQLARVHALWGLGQLARRDARHARSIAPFLTDADPEIRAQAAKLVGDLRYAPAAGALVTLLRDTAPRARFFAAEALGKIDHAPAIPAIVRMLEENADADLQLRQSGAIALARIGEAAPVAALADHPSRAVRIAAVIALRRMRDPGAARFLRDADEFIVTEAARAINDDESIEPALPALAAVLEETRFRGQPLLRRAINANLRVGSAEAARRVAAFATRAGVSDTLAVEAIATLGVWPKPSILDRVDGYPRQAVTRDSAVARAALAAIVESGLAQGSPAVQVALAEAAGRLRLAAAAPLLVSRVGSGATPEVRIAALRALQAIGGPSAEPAVRAALQDREAAVRMAALSVIPPLNLPEATTVELLSSVVERGTVAEQQTALAALGQLQGTTARQALTQLVDRLDRGGVPADIQLDVTEAARATRDPALVARVDRMQAARANAAPLVAYGDALRGGNAQQGQRVVINHPAAQCTRCHVVGGAPAAANVGPDLRGVASRLTREQLLEALVHPNARLAPGYGPVSAMPPMGGILTRRELRDVVEYLSTLR